MDWRLLIRAVAGQPAALKRLARKGCSHEGAVYAALLLLEDAPHPAAALVGAGILAMGSRGRLIMSALAPHAAPALAEWRAAPTWAARTIGIRTSYTLIYGVAHLIASLRTTPDALRDATAVVTRDAHVLAIASCLSNLGADGWGLLGDEERCVLWMHALRNAPDALGCVWSALTAAQQADAAQRVAAEDRLPAALIGRIGPSAWEATDAALRDLLIDAAAQAPPPIHLSASAWTGMSDAERERLVTAVVVQGRGSDAFDLLSALGADGRRALSPAQRAALDQRAAQHAECRTALLRVADAGWVGVDDDDRRTLMARAATDPQSAAAFIRAVGGDGWRALPPDVQSAARASVQRDPSALLACPPSLWGDLADGRPLPSLSSVASWVFDSWRAADADVDLSRLPPEHQASVLAIAPWRPDDLAPQSPRMARLLVAWNAMTPDARVALATAKPWTLAVVAAAARLCACARTTAVAAAAALETTAHVAADAAARATVGRMLAATERWRPWMRAFAPTDDDAPSVWDAWLAAALRGAIPDRAVVLRLMADAARGAVRVRRPRR